MEYLKLYRAFLPCVLCLTMLAVTAYAQQAEQPGVTANSPEASAPTANSRSELDEIRRQIRQQQQELEKLRATISEQSRVIDDLRQRVEQNGERSVSTPIIKASAPGNEADAGGGTQEAQGKPQQPTDATNARIEAVAKQLGSINFSGDVRLRYDQLFGLLNTLPNGSNPAIIGNELGSRPRMRVRVRLNLRGQIGKEFEWGIRLSSGSYSDAAVPNQTFTDFFNRKPFSLDNAYIAYSPSSLQGLRLQAGKFDIPWLRTELTFDNDLQPEGVNETYSRGFKNSVLKNLTFVAWQLPFLERNNTFVRNASGTVNVDESRRGGRDLAIYGAQLRARFEPTRNTALTLSVADLYYSGTQFITPVQFFGAQLQLPLTITIPATATSPAQTVTAQVSIARELLVAGAGILGISTASNNAVNRDGRLSSGYNLVDLIGRLDITRSKRFPVALIFNMVTNTQTRDVVLAGPSGENIFLPNNENKGYWAEIQVGKQRDKGDMQFGYTFMRIEKDAVLTPFNFSELTQQSDVRVQRLVLHYSVDPRVLLSFIGFVVERPNGLLGVFGQSPPGSLNRPTTRIQFETTFRF